jgi:hypothetical protein
MNELILDTDLDETYFLQEGNELKLHTNMIKEIVITTCALVSTCAASTVTFSDQFDLLVESEFNYNLDGSAYANTMIGLGNWMISIPPPASIQSLSIAHSIILFGEGMLDRVIVSGSAIDSSDLSLLAESRSSQSFASQLGARPDTYIFDLSGFNLHQEGDTVISGFSAIESIKFEGRYTNIPEASALLTYTVILLPCFWAFRLNRS